MPPDLFPNVVLPPLPAGPTPADVLAETRPAEPMCVAGAEARLAELAAHVAAIGRQLDDRAKDRRRGDPAARAAWRRAAGAAREELRREERSLRAFLDRERARLGAPGRTAARAADLARQDADRADRDVRRAARRGEARPLWDLYLKAEVALVTIVASGGDVGPLGDSLLHAAQRVVPEAYRDHWLRTAYGTTWGREAARAARRPRG